MHRISILLCLLGVFLLSVSADGTTPASCTSGGCCLKANGATTGTVKPSGALCRSQTPCRNEARCDGVSSQCPAVSYLDANEPCDPVTDSCINDGVCDGAGTCQAPQNKPTGTECVAADPANCLQARTCTSGTCNAAVRMAKDTVCAQNTTICEKKAVCGTTGVCPAKGFAPASTTCAFVDDSTCTVTRKCTGSSITCPDSTADTSVPCKTDDCSNYFCPGNSHVCSTTPTPFATTSTECTPDTGACTGDDVATCNAAGYCGACTAPSSGGNDDPLITGFHNQRFWLEGVSGTIYNMFSQPGLSVNSLIVNAHAAGEHIHTVQNQIGVITKNNKILVKPLDGKAGKVVVNGKTVEFSAKQNVMDLEDCVQLAWSPKSVMISSAEFEVVLAFMTANPQEDLNVDYLNLKLVHVSGDVTKMSGIVGQTAHIANKEKIDGNWADFQVSDMFAADDLMNTFNGADITCDDSAVSKRNIGKFEAATAHQLDDMGHYANSNA